MATISLPAPNGLRRRQLSRTSLPRPRGLCYTAEVVSLLGAAGLLSRISAAQPAASKGASVVPPVRLTTMVKAAG